MFAAVLAAEPVGAAGLLALGHEFSPRVELPASCGGPGRPGSSGDQAGARELLIDATGLGRIFGEPRALGEQIRRTAADRGMRVRVAVAATRVAARLLVHHRAGVTIVPAGDEAATLAPLPIDLLRVLDDDTPRTPAAVAKLRSDTAKPHNKTVEPRGEAAASPLAATLRRWGLRTLGELAALPPDALASRLGRDGVRWQRSARGEDARPLVPVEAEERFEQALDLEWPIEGLEPLSFVLGRLMDPLAAHLQRRGRGAAVLHVRLQLVTRETYARSLELPVAMHDARTLRTLALLDLESHPPGAAIDRVAVAVEPTPARVVQHSLLSRPLPAPELLSTLTARLQAVMGEGRCGSPAMVDTWGPGAFGLVPFAPRDLSDAPAEGLGSQAGRESRVAVALRRFRLPIAARVRCEEGRPTQLLIDRPGLAGGRVLAAAGPWRSTGGWWEEAKALDHGAPRTWDRDEWEVTVPDGACYRIFRDRERDSWFVEAVVD